MHSSLVLLASLFLPPGTDQAPLQLEVVLCPDDHWEKQSFSVLLPLLQTPAALAVSGSIQPLFSVLPCNIRGHFTVLRSPQQPQFILGSSPLTPFTHLGCSVVCVLKGVFLVVLHSFQSELSKKTL